MKTYYAALLPLNLLDFRAVPDLRAGPDFRAEPVARIGRAVDVDVRLRPRTGVAPFTEARFTFCALPVIFEATLRTVDVLAVELFARFVLAKGFVFFT